MRRDKLVQRVFPLVGFHDRRAALVFYERGRLRSTFSRLGSQRTEFPREMAEIALAHNVGSEVERAYRRGDMLERRRGMMAAWGRFLRGEAGASVVRSLMETPL